MKRLRVLRGASASAATSSRPERVSVEPTLVAEDVRKRKLGLAGGSRTDMVGGHKERKAFDGASWEGLEPRIYCASSNALINAIASVHVGLARVT